MLWIYFCICMYVLLLARPSMCVCTVCVWASGFMLTHALGSITTLQMTLSWPSAEALWKVGAGVCMSASRTCVCVCVCMRVCLCKSCSVAVKHNIRLNFWGTFAWSKDSRACGSDSYCHFIFFPDVWALLLYVPLGNWLHHVTCPYGNICCVYVTVEDLLHDFLLQWSPTNSHNAQFALLTGGFPYY